MESVHVRLVIFHPLVPVREEVCTVPRRRSARSKSSPGVNFAEVLPDSITCEYDSNKRAFKLTKPSSHKGRYLEEFLKEDANPIASADRLILVHGEHGDDKNYPDPEEFEGKKVVVRKDGSAARVDDWLCHYKYKGKDVPFILSEVVSVEYLNKQGDRVGDSAFLPPRHYTP